MTQCKVLWCQSPGMDDHTQLFSCVGDTLKNIKSVFNAGRSHTARTHAGTQARTRFESCDHYLEMRQPEILQADCVS